MAMLDTHGSFPRYGDGDVEIRVSQKTEDAYILHSHVLRLHIPFFKASLSERWTGVEPISSSLKWKYELRFEPLSPEGILIRNDTDNAAADEVELVSEENDIILLAGSQKPPTTDPAIISDQLETIEAHRKLFRILYYKSCGLLGVPTHEIKPQINALLTVTDFYCCTEVVRSTLNTAIEFGSSKFMRECSLLHSHVEMLEISMKLRSERLFKEAMIHVVGRSEQQVAQINPGLEILGLADLMKCKRAELAKLIQGVQQKLLLPAFKPDLGRLPSYALALNHFRTEMIVKNASMPLDGDCASTFLELSSKRTRNEEFTARCKDFPATTSLADYSLDGFRECVGIIFEEIDKVIKPITKSYSRRVKSLPKSGNQLLCIPITDEDLPWNHA
ncbi:MAG: hypothetical protein M4579_002529 [Chaenotheca gracillima]|nr:MAG: hypothetical protein M4579_002529 [Chaenotheca gracillima]